MKYNGQTIPKYFMFCTSDTCPLAQTCLRRQMLKQLPADNARLEILNPNYANTIDDDTCRHFKKYETQRVAYGFIHMLDKLPYAVARSIRAELDRKLTHAGFYRCKNGTLPTTPDKQALIKRVFRNHGIAEDPIYDKMVDEYVF